MSARKNLYNYISTKGPGKYSGQSLGEVTEIRDWMRALRQLKQDEIIDYEYDKSSDTYLVCKIGPYTGSRRSSLSSKDRYRIRHRDGHRCQSCGKSAKDEVTLHVDHKIPVEWEGTNEDSNLWTLCSQCNLAKKAFFKDDFDSEVMKKVYQESSGYQRLKVLFENSPNVKFPPSILQGIAGIRDWTRTIRDIRKKHNININWIPFEENFPDGYYVNQPSY